MTAPILTPEQREAIMCKEFFFGELVTIAKGAQVFFEAGWNAALNSPADALKEARGVYRKWSAEELAQALMQYPTYRVLLVPEEFLFPSPWCEDFFIRVNDKLEIIYLKGDFT